MENAIVPIILSVGVIIYIILYCNVAPKFRDIELVDKYGETNKANWIKIKLLFSVIVIVITIVDTYGKGKYEIFPNTCILIMALLEVTDLWNDFKSLRKQRK